MSAHRGRGDALAVEVEVTGAGPERSSIIIGELLAAGPWRRGERERSRND